jgi:hypothetical protein
MGVVLVRRVDQHEAAHAVAMFRCEDAYAEAAARGAGKDHRFGDSRAVEQIGKLPGNPARGPRRTFCCDCLTS